VTDDLRRIAAEDPEIVRAAGRELIALGELLVAGRIEEAVLRIDAARATYPEWAALDQAIAKLDAAARDADRTEANREAALGVLVAVLRTALRGAVGL
jgi:hypothetical protein